MCNCNSNNSLCSRCSKGLMCACPPDYSVSPLPVTCGCCPTGYTWTGPTLNWPNGVCTGPGGVQTSPIPCTSCESSLASDCIYLPEIACFGVPAGTTLTSFINTFMCSDAFIKNLLLRISLSSQLGTDFCQLVQACPPVGSGGTPVMGPVIITYI